MSRALRQLRRIHRDYGGDAGAMKLAFLRELERGRLTRPRDLLLLHEILCFLRAYPDDETLLGQVERMLSGWRLRPDLRRRAHALADTGMAGTPTRYVFFWPTARWLARRWGDRLAINWSEFTEADRLRERLPLLAHYAETPALDESDLSPREWIARMKRPDETDAAFVIRGFEGLSMGETARETFYQELAIPITLAAGPDTPGRTQARYDGSPTVLQAGPLRNERPSLAAEITRPPLAVRAVSRSEGRKLVDLARGAMVSRARDLDAFAYGNPEDVTLVDCGDGLQFAVIGLIPERRLLLESVYGFLTLRSGVPIGYVLISALFESSEIAYNIFETYRGAEAAYIYGKVLSVTRSLFGSNAFTIYPYQLGHHNDEGLKSGAWWFYQKLGFRPSDPEALRLMRRELGRMRADPAHRSDRPTLKRLAEHNVYYHLDRPRRDVIGVLPLGQIGLRVTDLLAARFGSARERAERACAREAAALLGVRRLDGFPAGERLAWNRWSPLVCLLPDAGNWSRAEKRAAVEVIRAKGGRSEIDFVRLFDRHARLRRGLAALAEGTAGNRPHPPV
jgi:hypothetical protein